MARALDITATDVALAGVALYLAASNLALAWLCGLNGELWHLAKPWYIFTVLSAAVVAWDYKRRESRRLRVLHTRSSSELASGLMSKRYATSEALSLQPFTHLSLLTGTQRHYSPAECDHNVRVLECLRHKAGALWSAPMDSLVYDFQHGAESGVSFGFMDNRRHCLAMRRFCRELTMRNSNTAPTADK